MSRRFGLALVAVLIWPFCAAGGEEAPVPAEEHSGAQATPLARAHAHNDYLHERPLLDALSHGFCSVEADVFLVDGKLLVGHERVDLKAERSLEALYLEPLLERVRANGGRVFPDGPAFTLLIDFKTDGEATYAALDSMLTGYEEMLTSVKDGRVEKGAVTVIISGNRSWETIAADATRYAGVDGRLSDLSSTRPAHMMPMISDHWGRTFTWSGEGPMPGAERDTLRSIVRAAHHKGRQVRFWATPDQPSPERAALWAELLAADVDKVNTDDLAGLETFLLSAAAARGR